MRSRTSLILTASDVECIMGHYGMNDLMDVLISRLDAAIISYDQKKTIIPVRSGFQYYSPKNGLLEWMPLLKMDDKVMMKVVGYHPGNPNHHQLPTILSNIAAYDTGTGHLIGIVDGVLLTALRTGAASAVASKYMASPNSQNLGIIGCGAQAVTQLHALSRYFDISEVIIYDISPKVMLSFKERVSVLGLDIEIRQAAIEEVVKSSDILVTATTTDVGSGPLFDGVTTRPHLHINAVGSDFPGKVELPLELLKESFVVPDFREQAILEGECQQLNQEYIGPSWVEVIQSYKDYDYLGSVRTVFDSTGWPLEDLVTMELFLEYGHILGLGKRMTIEHLSEDAKNPYHFLSKTVPAGRMDD